MNRKTLTAIAAFAVLGLIAIFALRQPEKGEHVAKARPVAKINSGDVDTLEITRAGATTTIVKDRAKYKVTAPVAYPADESPTKAAFEGLEKLEFSDLVTDQKAKQAEMEVDDAKGVRVVAKNSKQGGKVLADLYFGKGMGAGTMVRPAGKDEIWQTSGVPKYAFDKPTADWRDKSVTTFTAADAEKIDVKAKDGSKISLKKTGAKEGSDDKWEVVESSVKIDKLDNSVPVGIVSGMASFKTNDFADKVTPAESGLDAPALAVTVGLKGGKSATMLIGNKKGDEDFYVKTPEAPQVFLVKKYNLERINRRPIDFRDKTLCDIADTDLTDVAVASGDKSFTITKSGGTWKATKPAKLEIDPSKVSPVTSGFKDWKATGFADDPSPKATGLGKPKATIVAKSSSKKPAVTCTIKVGDETKDKQSYYVQVKAPDVLVAPKWSVDRILIKPDDMKKTSAAAAPSGPSPMAAGHP